MILVTGAAGKTGLAVTKSLATRGCDTRALVYRKDLQSSVLRAGARETIVGDLADPQVLREAFLGVNAVYHICPNVSPNEIEYGRNIIEAARWVGVQRLVYHSVLHPQIEAMPHHWAKLRVEELIFESGLPFTILQPAAYMQNLLSYWTAIKKGSYPIPYSAETILSMVDLRDVADAAAIVLNDPNHEGAIYELVGPDRYTQAEIAQKFAEKLNRPVQIEQVPLQRWEQDAKSNGLSSYQISNLVAMFRYYDQHNFLGNSMVLAFLLGRKATDLDSYIKRIPS